LDKTQAIVLKYINYSDSSIIVHLFTKNYGKQAYIVRGVRGKNSKTKINLLQPLNIIDIEAKHKLKSFLHNLQEYSLTESYKTIPYDIAKSSIALFISEVLSKTLKDGETDIELFNFVKKYINELDNNVENINNFHIIFLVRYTSFLGFFPNVDDNLIHKFTINTTIATITQKILDSQQLVPNINEITKANRNEILELLIEYYNIHLNNTLNIKSLDVLKSVFS
jgi:DNA repair protein RecO (recombination protein O)